VDIMRALWAGETVTHYGLVITEEARLYSLPAEPPLVVGAALSPETAEWVGSWADALITTNQPVASLTRMIDAFRSGGGEDKPMFLQVQLSYATTDEAARRRAHEQWAPLMLGGDVQADLRVPSDFVAAGKFVRPEDLEGSVLMSSDLAQHTAWLAERAELGFERMYLHNVNREQQRFIDDFGGQVLPAFA
jgi:alkanesulfonate monooxygenase SsuD/methylene tetrahydromethanopterin reductase-like flavin-dependent oxidoreductase (luciferase family)